MSKELQKTKIYNILKKPEIKKEIFRKIIHLFFIFVVIIPPYVPERTIEMALIILAFIYYFLEELRLRQVHIIIISKITSMALRKNEEKKFAYAPLMLMVGILLVLELYTTAATTAAIIAVTVGDSMAAICGKIFSSPRLFWNRKKTVIGTVANMVFVFLVALLFFDKWIIALVIGVSSAAIESLDLEHVDNLIIPLFVGAMMYLVVL